MCCYKFEQHSVYIRGILKLLCMLEHHGVNVCQQPPLLFGKMAAKLFSSQANSKPSKVSEYLSIH